MGADQSHLNNQTVNLLCKETGLSRHEIKELYTAFQKIRCSNGATSRLLLTVKDFKAAYATFYGEEGPILAELVFQAADIKTKGSVNFSDVIHMLSSLKDEQNFNAKAQWVFRMVDYDGDGEISYNDALHAITALYNLQAGFVPRENSTQPEILTHILFRNVESGTSGTISRSAFSKASVSSNMLQQLIEGTAKAVTKPLILESPMRSR